MTMQMEAAPADQTALTQIKMQRAPDNVRAIVSKWNTEAKRNSLQHTLSAITVHRPNNLPANCRLKLRIQSGAEGELSLGSTDDKNVKDAIAYLLKALGETVPFTV